MTIIITDTKEPLYMTEAEHRQWQDEYSRAFGFFYGSPPPFESWVRNQKRGLLTNDASKP